MAGNSYGSLFRLTTFGESHGDALGGIIDGCPAGIMLNFDSIRNEMQRRKPGQSSIVTQRKEEDEIQFLSKISLGRGATALTHYPWNNGLTVIFK